MLSLLLLCCVVCYTGLLEVEVVCSTSNVVVIIA